MMSSARSTWADENLKCVEVLDVVSLLQDDLTEIKERLGSQNSQIERLQLSLRNADLEQFHSEAQQTYQGLQRRWNELNAQLSIVAGQQKRSLETIMSLKCSVKQLSHDCNALTATLSRVQTAPNETEPLRTFLTFTSDVQPQSSDLHPAIPRLMLAHAISQPRNLLMEESARFDTGAPTTRREQAPTPVKRRVTESQVCLPDEEALAEWEMKRSADIKELKASVRLLEQKLIPEKEKLVDAQTRANQGRNQRIRAKDEIDSSRREFRSMKKQQREMEEEIRRLKEMHGVVQPKGTADDREDLRLGLVEGRHKNCPVPGWLGTVVPQLGQRLRCSVVSHGGLENLQRAKEPAEPQIQGRPRHLTHPEL
jgi:predicted  nucleic acid-binding Zn-ribbon protein